ncbi:MAG: phosphoenolpyruvate--protein phosphotransferase [Acidimicrobiales bacterium]|nr:phosphoenolpyruvate--protein phosphotransferase [Acidimicrobiales bacterium]
MRRIQGVAASKGVAVAPIIVIEEETVVVPNMDDPAGALVAAGSAVSAHLSNLSAEAAERGRKDAAEVLNAQALMAEDSMIADAVEEHLDDGENFDTALQNAATELQAMLASLPDPYLAARAADVGEVTDRLRRHLAGLPLSKGLSITEPSILCAAQITAAETATLDPNLVVGFATVEGGPTSHVAIIARSIGVPAVVGIPDLLTQVQSGEIGGIDGSTGELFVDLDDTMREELETRAAAEAAAHEAAQKFKGKRVSYRDAPVRVSANVANLDDVERAVAQNADGVGLMRTEFLFMDRPAPPSEDEQVEVYTTALSSFSDPVVIRTFDIGGDKPADFLEVDEEENPFLGVRGVRLYRNEPELFRTQLRALLRAAVAGELWVMIPMVATTSELVEVKEQLSLARDELAASSTPVGDLKLGVMIEVPSAALTADALAQHADFFSIGTNDLTQYAMAADRMSGTLEYLHDPVHPAVLALCQMTAKAGLRNGCPVSVCGEAAADPLAAALFMEMGITKLSVSAPSVNGIKAVIDQLDPEMMAEIQEQALSAADAPAVRMLNYRS